MKVLRFATKLSLTLTWVFVGLILLFAVFPFVPLARRLAIKRWWSKVLLQLCAIKVRYVGSPLQTGPVLWVINHVSWLDIFALNQVRAAVFIAKSEIRRWPVLGGLVTGADTIFIERASRHALKKVGHAMQEKFDRQQVVGLFPEGTTSPGYDLLPFYANLFEPARRANVPIQPVALLYFHQGKRSDFAAFVGEENLLQNIWKVFGGKGVRIEIQFLPPLCPPDVGDTPTRAQLGRWAHQRIRAEVLRR